MAVAYTKTDKNLSVVIDWRPVTIPSSHPNFERLVELVKDPNTTEDQVNSMLDIPKAIETFTGGNVTIINGRLFYKGFEVRTSLAQLILKMVKAGDAEAAKPFELFLEYANENPDPRAGQDLYDWVAASNLPITSDGHILAWKAVANDYKSIHDRKTDNSVGKTVEMPRHLCDANPSRTCSTGLHFCSAEYLRHYASGGHRVVALKINPRDVVAFPKDYGNQKGRAAKYEVVGEVPFDKVKEFYPQGRAVYSGWTPPARVAERHPNLQQVAKAPTSNGCGSTKPLLSGVKVGTKLRLNNGTIYTVSSTNSGNKTYPVRASNGPSRLMFTLDGKNTVDPKRSTAWNVVKIVG